MAQPLRIDELTALTAVSGSAAIPLVQDGATYRATPGEVRAIVHLADYLTSTQRAAIEAGTETSIDTAVASALADLRTATPNPGGTILFPAGQLSTSGISVTQDGVTFVGEAVGANRTDEQGATVMNVSGSIGVLVDGVYGFRMKGMAVKNATTANIKINNTQFFTLDEVASLGSSVPTGIWVTGSSYFGLINKPNVSGLSGVGAVGVKINAGANENTIAHGCVRQNTTNVEIDDANNVRIIAVDMEGSSSQTGVSVAPTNSADATVIGCRLEGLLNGILLGSNATMLCAMGNHYGGVTNGIVDNSSNHRLGIFEPHLYNAATPGVLAFVMHDAIATGGKIGSTTIKNITGGNEINAGSGKLLLSTTGGNPVDLAGAHMSFTERSDASAPSANIAVIYARDNGGKTELVARFNTGAIQRIAIEP